MPDQENTVEQGQWLHWLGDHCISGDQNSHKKATHGGTCL